MSVGHLEVGPDRFPVAIQGSGPTLLFVHGAPGDWRSFAPHAALLADRYRCITYTQRWFGNAAWREDGPPFGTEAHADDLVALADALGEGRLALVAWSYGAHVAFKAALDRPDLFSALLAYEPGFGTFVSNPGDAGLFRRDAEAAWQPVFDANERGDTLRAVRAMWEGSGGVGAYDRLDPEARAMLEDSAPAMPRLVDQTPPVPLTCRDLGELQIPTTIAWGVETRPCFAIPARTAADCIGGDKFEIDGVGHLWPAENPAGFTRMIDFWFSRLREAGSV